MLATKRNIWKDSLARRANARITAFPGFSLVFLRDWCITAKLLTDWDTYRLVDFDTGSVSVRVLSEPMKVKAPKSMTHFSAVVVCLVPIHDRRMPYKTRFVFWE